jgi:hypothetical protein
MSRRKTRKVGKCGRSEENKDDGNMRSSLATSGVAEAIISVI